MILTDYQILKLINWIACHEDHNGSHIDYVELEKELKSLDLGDE